MKIRGFTFIEIILVVIISGVLAGISIPQFRKYFSNMELKSSSSELQAVMNYLRQRSISEGDILCLNIDGGKKEYWIQIKGEEKRLKTSSLPRGITIDTEKKEIFFYPNGSIDKVTIKLANDYNQSVVLTTKGVFGGVKILPEK